MINPPLTLVRQSAGEMGRAATEFLIQLIENKRPLTEFEKRVLLTELQVRDSSASLENKPPLVIKKQKTGVYEMACL